MEKKEFKKLMEVVENNSKWPLIIENVNSDIFTNSVVIPSDIDSRKLGVLPSGSGDIIPMWYRSLLIKSKGKDKVLLIIDGLDMVDKDSQEEFYGLLKMKKLNGMDLPENTQILITVKDTNKVSNKIKGLSLIYKVE